MIFLVFLSPLRADFATHQRTAETTHIYGADVILFEGIMVFCDEKVCFLLGCLLCTLSLTPHAKVRDLMDMKIFVDTDADTRLVRRIRRDIQDRGRTLEGTLLQYERTVKVSVRPCFPLQPLASCCSHRYAARL